MQIGILLLGIVVSGDINGDVSDTYGPRYGAAATETSAAASGAKSAPAVIGEPSQQYSRQQIASQPLRSTIGALSTAPISALPASVPPASAATANVAPAGGNAELTKVVKPVELLRTLSQPTAAEKLVGVPFTLAEAVQSAPTRAEQTRRVTLYWELSQCVAEYHLVALEAVQLSSIYDGLGLAEPSPVWQQAQQTIAARSKVARSAVQVAQLRLQEALGRRRDNSLPLPNDLPHCGAYQTRFDEIFRGRTSSEAKQLSLLLPLRHQELGQRAKDTMAARQWYSLVSRQRSPQSDGRQLLKAYENLALQRSAFVSAAHQYNANIVRYTALAVPQNVGAVRLVAMLIPTAAKAKGKTQLDQDWQRGAVQRAAAEQALPEQSPQRPARRTFSEGGRSQALRVPADAADAERSILVAPRTP